MRIVDRQDSSLLRIRRRRWTVGVAVVIAALVLTACSSSKGSGGSTGGSSGSAGSSAPAAKGDIKIMLAGTIQSQAFGFPADRQRRPSGRFGDQRSGGHQGPEDRYRAVQRPARPERCDGVRAHRGERQGRGRGRGRDRLHSRAVDRVDSGADCGAGRQSGQPAGADRVERVPDRRRVVRGFSRPRVRRWSRTGTARRWRSSC